MTRPIDHEGYVELYRARLAPLDCGQALAFGTFCGERLWNGIPGPASFRELTRQLLDAGWASAARGRADEDPAPGFAARLREAAAGLNPKAPDSIAAARIAWLVHRALEGTPEGSARAASMALEIVETVTGSPPGDWRDHAPEPEDLRPALRAEYEFHISALARLKDPKARSRDAFIDLLQASGRTA